MERRCRWAALICGLALLAGFALHVYDSWLGETPADFGFASFLYGLTNRYPLYLAQGLTAMAPHLLGFAVALRHYVLLMRKRSSLELDVLVITASMIGVASGSALAYLELTVSWKPAPPALVYAWIVLFGICIPVAAVWTAHRRRSLSQIADLVTLVGAGVAFGWFSAAVMPVVHYFEVVSVGFTVCLVASFGMLAFMLPVAFARPEAEAAYGSGK